MDLSEAIDWRHLDLSTPEKLEAFGARIERIGRAAVAAEIAAHKAAGNPIYYGDPAEPDDDILIKEFPDGSRQRIRVCEDGGEIPLGGRQPA